MVVKATVAKSLRGMYGEGLGKGMSPEYASTMKQWKEARSLMKAGKSLPSLGRSFLREEESSSKGSWMPQGMSGVPQGIYGGSSGKGYFKGSGESFIQMLVPSAQELQKLYGIFPSVTLGQAALESGWGKHAPRFNLFGHKGSGPALTTTEFINGKYVQVKSGFRGYTSFEDSVMGHGRFLTNNGKPRRYLPALRATDPVTQLSLIKQAGYATDPKYISKVLGIMRAKNLMQYDLQGC